MKRTGMMACILGISRSLFALVVALLIEQFTNSVMAGDKAMWQKVVVASAIYLLIYITLYYFSKFFINKFKYELKLKLSGEAFKALLGLNYQNVFSKENGEYVQQIDDNTAKVVTGYYENIMQIIFYISSYIAALVLLIWYNFWVALLAVALILLYTLINKRINKTIDVEVNAFFDLKQKKTQSIIEMSTGFNTIREYQGEEKFLAKHVEVEQELGRKIKSVQILTQNSMMVMTRSSDVINMCIIMLGAYMIYRGNNLFTIAQILALEEIVAGVLNPISSTESRIQAMRQSRRPKKDLEKLISDGKSQSTSYKEIKQTSGYALKIDKLNFAYKDKSIFKDYSINFEEGKKYAIVGESGKGKSTLLKLILKILEPQSGTIIIGNEDYSNLSAGDINNNIAYVGQNAYLFNDTVKNNIITSSEKNYTDALETSGVSLFLDKLPDGENTMISDNSNISGGQKMRISLARALCSSRRIMLLDEYSSSLDEDTYLAVEEKLLNLKDVTVITVTHKINESSAKKYDAIYEL